MFELSIFDPFVQFSLIIVVVLIVSVIVKLLKQPLIIGYILTGIIVGPFFLNLVRNNEILTTFSEMGISFLLFIVGLHLSPKIIKEVGKISLTTGVGQIVFTSLVGLGIAFALGFSLITALYIAIAVSFSSTIIIMKLLSDKDALEKLYGKISIGFLLIQDLVAIILLIVISSLATGNGAGSVLLLTLLKGIIVIAVLVPVSHYLLPRLSDFLAKSQEVLFLFAVSWGFGLSVLFYVLGFSIEVGALLAGVLLSMSPYSYEISSKLKPLRDFFIIAFFIILGSQMEFGSITHLILPAIVFSFFILIGNPFIVMILMGMSGYSKKTGFMAGLTVSQISEFSLILISLGVKVGSLSQEILSFITLIALITIAGSSYLIIYSDQIFKKISKFLTIFEKKKIREKKLKPATYDFLLLGYNRIGFSILKAFAQTGKTFLVVDYNPEVVRSLQEEGISALYGDVDDSEFLEDLAIGKMSLIVSTIPGVETNKLILEILKRNNADVITVLTAFQVEDAFDLYHLGANYVIQPHILGGELTSKLIIKGETDKEIYIKQKEKDIKLLRERIEKGFLENW